MLTTYSHGFLSTGDKTAMYTLRVAGLREVVIDGKSQLVHADQYIKNLSTDKAKAEAEALKICEFYGIPFYKSDSFELNEIKRKTAAEAEATRQNAEKIAKAIAEAEAAEAEAIEAAGLIIIGKYVGKTCDEIAQLDDVDYIKWLAKQADASGKLGICGKIAAKWVIDNVKPSEYIGDVGETLEVTATLKFAFVLNSRFYSVCFIAETETGDIVKFYTTAKAFMALENGDKFTFSGLVNEHSTYNGDKQTTFKRPKMTK